MKLNFGQGETFGIEIKKLAVVVHVLWTTQNLVISRYCCFVEDGKEMYQELWRMCTAITHRVHPSWSLQADEFCRSSITCDRAFFFSTLAPLPKKKKTTLDRRLDRQQIKGHVSPMVTQKTFRWILCGILWWENNPNDLNVSSRALLRNYTSKRLRSNTFNIENLTELTSS